MASFKKTQVPVYPRGGIVATPDTLYWKKLGFPFTKKEPGAIEDVSFSPVEPHYFAVSASTRVQVYDPVSNQIYRKLSRFQVAAYGASFRQDGKLLVAGDDAGLVRIFDVDTKNVLRFYKGHKGPVHKCAFLADNTNVVSFSDDKTIGVWDVPTEKQVHSFQDNNDYIRAGAASKISPDIFFSGCYDHIVRMYDLRVPEAVLTVDHGSPVEAILIFPSSGLFLSAGSVDIKVWDALAGGRLLAKITQHHKTVTSLCFASGAKRIASGSLDGHVKIYDVSSYQSVHSMKFPSPILCLGIAPDDSVLTVGMADGLLSVQQRQRETLKDDAAKLYVPKGRKDKISHKYLLEAKSYKPLENDLVVKNYVKRKFKPYDNYLRRFESTKALDTVLLKYRKGEKPEVVVAVLQELIRRGAITSAIAARNPRDLSTLLHFIHRNIRDHRYMATLIDITNILLDLYPTEMIENTQVKKLLRYLTIKLNQELNFMKSVMSLKGTIEILLGAADAKGHSTVRNNCLPITNEESM